MSVNALPNPIMRQAFSHTEKIARFCVLDNGKSAFEIQPLPLITDPYSDTSFPLPFPVFRLTSGRAAGADH